MKKIIALGGGRIGREGVENETFIIDKAIIEHTGKTNPKVLFFPTATSYPDRYIKNFKLYFETKHKCTVDVLDLRYVKNPEEIKKKILSTDIIYIGGGNTLRMMKRFRKYKIDEYLREAWEKGIVMSGLSAGAICWFKYGHSNSHILSSKGARTNYIKVKGLNYYPLTITPHFHTEKREKDFEEFIHKHGGIGIALDDNTALEIVEDKFRILKSKDDARAYKFYKSNGKVVSEELNHGDYTPIEYLI